MAAPTHQSEARCGASESFLPRTKITGVLCNGSTHALGACSPGSNPGTPTEIFSAGWEDLDRVQFPAPRQSY